MTPATRVLPETKSVAAEVGGVAARLRGFELGRARCEEMMARRQIRVEHVAELLPGELLIVDDDRAEQTVRHSRALRLP